MNGREILFGVAIAGAMLGVNCGGNSDENPSPNNTSAGGNTSVGGNTSAGGGAGDVGCGQTRCTPPDGSALAPCCMSQFDSKCGVLQGTTCAAPPPPSTSGCPTLGGGGFTLTGCCATNGMCGIDVSMFMPGAGCIDLATVGQFSMGMEGGFGFTLPPPQACPP